MSNRKYLGDIDGADLQELFFFKNSVDSLNDFKRMLDDPNPYVVPMIKEINKDDIDRQIEEFTQKKEKKFEDIHNKYAWMQVAEIPNLIINEDGKVYSRNSHTCQCSIDCKTC